MNVLVLGAGAMGSYYGAQLIQAGASVSFLVRERRASQLLRDGLRVKSELGDFDGPVNVVRSDDDLSPADLVILSCKAYDIYEAMRSISPAVGPTTRVLPVLNGLQPYGYLDAAFQRERVLGAAAYIAVSQREDGLVEHSGLSDRLIIGARTESQQTLVQQLLGLFVREGGQRSVEADIDQVLWNKWVMLCAGAAATCLLRGSISQILATTHGRNVIRGALDECLATAAAEGRALPLEAVSSIEAFLLTPASAWMASMARDIDAGKPKLEADCIVGDMVVRAARHGIPAPTLEAALSSLHVYLQRAGH